MKELRFYQNFYFVTYRYGKVSRFDRRSGSPFHYFNYMLHGAGKIVTPDFTLEVEAGDMYFIPKGLSYQSYWRGDDYVEIASCATAIFPEAHTEPFYPPGQEAKYYFQDWGTPAISAAPYKLQKLPGAFLEEYLTIPRDAVPDTNTLARFFAWLDRLLPCLQKEELDQDALLAKKFSAFVDNNPGARIPEIARHCKVSESSLYEQIHRATGKTPNEFRKELLVNKAVHLLSTTNKSVQKISEVLQFSSSTYFRKVIKEHTGKSPSQIRLENNPR